MLNVNISDAAFAYLLKMPRPYQREVAWSRCTSHLVECHGFSEKSAGLAAIQAIAELETKNQRAYIDADATTAHVVIVRRPGMDALALSVSDLLRLHAQGYTPSAPLGETQH